MTQDFILSLVFQDFSLPLIHFDKVLKLPFYRKVSLKNKVFSFNKFLDLTDAFPVGMHLLLFFVLIFCSDNLFDTLFSRYYSPNQHLSM